MKLLPGWIFNHYLSTQSSQTWRGVRFITIIPVYMQWALGNLRGQVFGGCILQLQLQGWVLKTSADIASMSNCGCSLISSSVLPSLPRSSGPKGDVSKVGLPDPVSILDQLAGQLDVH